jgi:sulfiredoxin
MMKRESFLIANVYIPTRRRPTLDAKKVQVLAESILQVGQQTPILLRRDGDRFVLVEGLHRLEACRALGETSIDGYLVDARKH